MDGVADAQAGIPQGLGESGTEGFEGGNVGFAANQDQQVDVGIGKELAASVASAGGDGEARLMAGWGVAGDGIGDDLIDRLGSGTEDLVGIVVCGERGRESQENVAMCG